MQFTATPFREDGKPLDGEIIYKYPLRKAQEEEYFKPIRFRPVSQFNRKRADESIAAKAIEHIVPVFKDQAHILKDQAHTAAIELKNVAADAATELKVRADKGRRG